jgi:hypothetical protein
MDIIFGLQHMIRVVKAFRHGVDTVQLNPASSNVNIQRVIQKQASLNKRLSSASGVPHGNNQAGNEQAAANSHVVQLPTRSHTETAV